MTTQSAAHTPTLFDRLAAEGRPIVDIASVFRAVPASVRGVSERCVCCGKPVGKAPVYLLGCMGSTQTIAAHVDNDVLEAADPGYMGGFPVGVECAKRVAKLVRAAGGDPDAYLRA